MSSCQKSPAIPMPISATFQIMQPAVMMFLRFEVSAARPMKRPVMTNVAEKP